MDLERCKDIFILMGLIFPVKIMLKTIINSKINKYDHNKQRRRSLSVSPGTARFLERAGTAGAAGGIRELWEGGGRHTRGSQCPELQRCLWEPCPWEALGTSGTD